MYGNNKRMKQEITDGSYLLVTESFISIQGEGPFAGIPAFFIRLSGCNLACHFCDTYFDEVGRCSINEAAAHAEAFVPPSGLVVITGGEPLRQTIGPMVAQLLKTKGVRHVQIETAGTLWDPTLEPLMRDPRAMVSIVCSPKTPKIHPKIEEWCSTWKYIITHGEVSEIDGLPITSTQIKNKLAILYRPQQYLPTDIFLQPCDTPDHEQNVWNRNAALNSCMQYGYRLCLQLHKIVEMQ